MLYRILGREIIVLSENQGSYCNHCHFVFDMTRYGIKLMASRFRYGRSNQYIIGAGIALLMKQYDELNKFCLISCLASRKS